MKLDERVDTRCPWCGEVVSTGLLRIEGGDDLPAGDEGSCVVLHAEPTCPMFDAMDGDNFAESLMREGARRRGVA